MVLIAMSERDLQRIEVLSKVIGRRMTLVTPAHVLGLNERQSLGLHERIRTGDAASIRNNAIGRPSAAISASVGARTTGSGSVMIRLVPPAPARMPTPAAATMRMLLFIFHSIAQIEPGAVLHALIVWNIKIVWVCTAWARLCDLHHTPIVPVPIVVAVLIQLSVVRPFNSFSLVSPNRVRKAARLLHWFMVFVHRSLSSRPKLGRSPPVQEETAVMPAGHSLPALALRQIG